MSVTPVQAYGEWIATVDNRWDEHVLNLAYRQLIDTIAVIMPGAVSPVAQKVLARAHQWGKGDITGVGTTSRFALPWAAMLNATAGHALDFDDNYDPAKCHVSTVFWPVIFAVAEQENSTPHDCLDAYIIATQITGRVGQAINPHHRKRGWHSTSTTGAIGAAAAAARLMKLNSEQSAMAISLATSVAGGFMSQFGTMAKPLHAGNAAKGGILSACFAQDGMTAGLDTLAGPTGMNTLMVGPDRDELQAAITEPEHGQTMTFEMDNIGDPILIEHYQFRVKRWPTCGSAHRSMDAMTDLLEEYKFTADDVDKVDVYAPAMHLKNLMYERPVDGLQGKFSVEYPLSCAMLQGECTLNDFTDKAVNRSTLQSMMKKIYRHPIELPETETDTTIKVSLKDGHVIEKSVFMPRGSKAAPYPTEQYWKKFQECTVGIMSSDDQSKLKEKLENFYSLERASEFSKCMGVELIANDSSGGS